MGNRGGCMHNDRRELTRRRWVSKRWITCVLTFKARHRTVMAPRRYTELFFLDEATALAAGHRPCYECRREDSVAFANAWAKALDLSKSPTAAEMDHVLHAERGVSGRAHRDRPMVSPAALPNGTMVALPTEYGDPSAWLILDGTLHLWTFSGYRQRRNTIDVPQAELITAPSIVAALRAGYPVRLSQAETI